jgi:hypothetical protein
VIELSMSPSLLLKILIADFWGLVSTILLLMSTSEQNGNNASCLRLIGGIILAILAIIWFIALVVDAIKHPYTP